MADTKARDAEQDLREGESEAPEGEGEEVEAGAQAAITPNPHAPITPLTMPTTVQKLRNWLLTADAIGPGADAAVSVTGTTMSIA
jgi:hypothetical protein